MVHKNQIMNGIFQFIEREWMPKAETEKDRIAFRVIQSACRDFPDALWNKVKTYDVVEMSGAIVGDEADIERLANSLTFILGTDEVRVEIPMVFTKRPILISADDIRALKGYIERA